MLAGNLPLFSKSHPWGIPRATGGLTDQAQAHNEYIATMFDLTQVALAAGVPFVVLQPPSSFLWYLPPFVEGFRTGDLVKAKMKVPAAFPLAVAGPSVCCAHFVPVIAPDISLGGGVRGEVPTKTIVATAQRLCHHMGTCSFRPWQVQAAFRSLRRGNKPPAALRPTLQQW